MRSPAWFALLAAGLLLTGCSLWNEEGGEPAGSLQPAPPVRSMNEIVPPPPEDVDADVLVFDQNSVLERACPGVEPAQCKPSKERYEAVQRRLRQEHEAMDPAGGTEQRVIATLPLSRGGDAALIAWRARNGRLCVKVEIRYPDSTGIGIGGGWGPFDSCEPRSTCGQVCLARATEIPKTTGVLTGTVSSSGDELRVTFLDGERRRYPLRGPVVPGFPESRVFMLDLGPRLYERLELFADGKVSASVDTPREEIEVQLCFRRFRVSTPELRSCLRKAAEEDTTDG